MTGFIRDQQQRGFMSIGASVRAVAIMLATLLAASSAVAQDCNSEGQVKSAGGGAPTEIEFANSSTFTRRIYWVTETGARRFQTVLPGGAKHRQPTSAAHYWIVTDDTEKCLHVILATTAPAVMEVGELRGAAVSPPPPGQTTSAAIGTTVMDLRRLTGWHEIRSVARQGLSLNTLDTSNPVLVRVRSDWHSAHWQFEPVGVDQLRIKNRWKSAYLVVDRGALRVAASSGSNPAGLWTLEAIPGEAYGRIRNGGDGRYLVSTDGGFDLLSNVNNKVDSFWLLQPASTAQAGDSDNSPVKSTVRSEPESKKTCPKHYTLRKGDCVSKASLCSNNENYSSSVEACIPKEIPKPKVKSCSKGTVWDSDEEECVPIKCARNWKLINGECRLQQNCGANAFRSPEGDCYCKTGFQKFQGECVKKSIAEPWNTPACKLAKSACSAGSKQACQSVESLCNPN